MGTRIAASLMAIVIGATAAVLAFLLDMPGQGIFVWTTIGLGLLAGATVGTRWGALLTIASEIATVLAAAVARMLMDPGTGMNWLVGLIVAILTALLGFGYLAGWVVRRVVTRKGAALRETEVMQAILWLAACGVLFWWFAGELAQNPP